ncbi:hypothetical protein D3C81_2337020 [compost metagenome]
MLVDIRKSPPYILKFKFFHQKTFRPVLSFLPTDQLEIPGAGLSAPPASVDPVPQHRVARLRHCI